MQYLVHPQDLIFQATFQIEGFKDMIGNEEVPHWDLEETATQIVTEWTQDWDSDQGFGSSDGAYMLKDFIDSVIAEHTISGGYETKFDPQLKVIGG